MFKNKTQNGMLNICGVNIKALRKQLQPPVSQRMLADKLQLLGIDLDKNAIQKIECGKRFVTDIEILAIAKVFNITVDKLLS